jgi:predicted dienelactone hydrolase
VLHRTRTWAHFALILVVLFSLSVVFAQDTKPEAVGLRPDAPAYAVHGPYWVGTREFTIPDKDGKRPLPLTVWYPALNPKGVAESITYSGQYPPVAPDIPFNGHALLDAQLDAQHGPYPLVLFSHGSTGSRYSSLYLVEHLASYGFVVMSADHTGDTVANSNDKGAFLQSHATRPRDISREIDFAEVLTAAGGDLDGMIDMKHVAVTGHSSGGWTALLAAGAQRDYEALNAWCAKYPDDFFTCGNLKGQEKTLADLLGLGAVPSGLWPSVGDPRVTTIVLFAPGNTPAFGKKGLGVIKVPTMLVTGSGDGFLPFDIYAKQSYQDLGSAIKDTVVFDQGGHMLFGNGCSAVPWMATPDMFWVCADSVWDSDRAHDLINHFTTAFLLDILKSDKEAAKALAPDAVSFPGIDYKAQGF